MQWSRLIGAVLSSLALGSCTQALFLENEYELRFPPLSGQWAAVLGRPAWRVEWVDREGRRHAREGTAGDQGAISVPEASASAILAYPFWNERRLAPGLLRPAGAIAPYDIRSGAIELSWQGGVDAWVYQHMAAQPLSDNDNRRAPSFDWPRFRESVASSIEDPWLVDWEDFCERTMQMGFDRRRIKADAFVDLEAPDDGPWISSSPFASALRLRASIVETLVSPRRVLRVNDGLVSEY